MRGRRCIRESAVQRTRRHDHTDHNPIEIIRVESEKYNYCIRLGNIRGLPVPKVVELQSFLLAGEVICITETQHKTDSAKFNSNITRYTYMREVNDKKEEAAFRCVRTAVV